MRGSIEPEEFERRVRFLVQRLSKAKPGRPVVLITHFLNSAHYPAPGKSDEISSKQGVFDTILRDLAGENENLFLIEGMDVLPEAGGLSCDLVHPQDYGHIVMGENLARLLQPVVGKVKR